MNFPLEAIGLGSVIFFLGNRLAYDLPLIVWVTAGIPCWRCVFWILGEILEEILGCDYTQRELQLRILFGGNKYCDVCCRLKIVEY